jgi:hypothetical protein
MFTKLYSIFNSEMITRYLIFVSVLYRVYYEKPLVLWLPYFVSDFNGWYVKQNRFRNTIARHAMIFFDIIFFDRPQLTLFF